MEAKHFIFAAFIAYFIVSIEGFFLTGAQTLGNTFFNNTIFGNGTNNSLADLFTNLIANHVTHTVSSVETIARIAEQVAGQKFGIAANATSLAGNFTGGIIDAFRNLTEAKLNLTSQAAGTIVNASTQLFSYGVQSAELIPKFAVNLANAFG